MAASDLHFKDSIVVGKNDVLKLKDIYKEKFVLKVLDEEFFVLYIGLAFTPFHFLLKPFNDIILRLVQSGLIDIWLRTIYGEPINGHILEFRKPVVLTWNHIYVGFYICFACLAVSIVCFICEILHFRLSLFIKSQKDFIMP